MSVRGIRGLPQPHPTHCNPFTGTYQGCGGPGRGSVRFSCRSNLLPVPSDPYRLLATYTWDVYMFFHQLSKCSEAAFTRRPASGRDSCRPNFAAVSLQLCLYGRNLINLQWHGPDTCGYAFQFQTEITSSSSSISFTFFLSLYAYTS